MLVINQAALEIAEPGNRRAPTAVTMGDPAHEGRA